MAYPVVKYSTSRLYTEQIGGTNYMKATKKFDHLEPHEKIAVNTDELQALLSCGRSSAV